MRALALDFDSRSLALVERPEPGAPGPGEVQLAVRGMGVCGTDRELASFHYGEPPPGARQLVLGHEAAAEVVCCGTGVAGLAMGDLVAPRVRRPCAAPCLSCARGRADLCLSGGYTERGILGLDGYFQEQVIAAAEELERVPRELGEAAVLVEPLSVVEKALEAAWRVHWWEPRTAIVLGAGPVGLLTGLALAERGVPVTLHSREDAGSARARLARQAGFRYTQNWPSERADVVIEATGSAEVAGAALDLLAPLGVLVLLGAAEFNARVPGLRLVLENQAVIGSINASPESFARAARLLPEFDRQVVEGMLRRRAAADFGATILGLPEEPKPVHLWD
jgi:threonine dehydrogenase-like Zn-dependent dehydrogenase